MSARIEEGWENDTEETREEMIDALQADRAHHDELGRTDENGDLRDAQSSPREQPAAANRW
jgi:hypothetical protein